MKHIIFGGDGFVGRYLARDLLAMGEEVLVCDIRQSKLPIYPHAAFQSVDICDKDQVAQVAIGQDDVVYNMAARMLHPVKPRRERQDWFFSVLLDGTFNIVEAMERADCRNLIQFSTDMVYGRPQTPPPLKADHPRVPLGEYADAKKHCEDLVISQRPKGLKVSVFRPRMILGPGRLGILTNLFKLIERSLPVPMIGNGRNCYQMISVFDCASAAWTAWQKGIPNAEFNLGSANPPSVRELLGGVIKEAGSNSFLVPTPAKLVKETLRFLDVIGMTLLVPEQFEIADTDYIVDIELNKELLDWTPRFSDQEMLEAAFREYKDHGTGHGLVEVFAEDEAWSRYLAEKRIAA